MKRIRGKLIIQFYCDRCYKTYESDILQGASWVVWCRKDEQRRRWEMDKWAKHDPPIYFEPLENYADIGRGADGEIIAVRDNDVGD